MQTDVAKDFQQHYESSNNGQYWGSYFDGATYNRPKTKKTKKDNMDGCYNIPVATCVTTMAADTVFSFGTFPCPAPCQTAACTPAKAWPTKQKGNNPMYVDNDKHIESAKINYLSDRATNARFAAQDKIVKAFNLNKPAAPKTPEALVDAITSGNYTVKPKDERSRYDGVFDSIVWRAPTVVADPNGAEAAQKVFDVLYKSAQDAIMIGTPADALVQVQALDAWTPTVGTVAS